MSAATAATATLTATVVPFYPFQSVARQLQRMGRPDLRGRFVRRVHAELAAGNSGNAVAAEVFHARRAAAQQPGGAA